jgi:hypothetical protein
MLDRRDFIVCLASQFAASTAFCAGTTAAVAATRTRSGCVLPRQAFERISFLNSSTPNGSSSVRSFRGAIIDGSGNAEFDQALGRAVLAPLAAEFSANPGFGYYDERRHPEHGQENALASSVLRIPSTRGTVVIGLALLERCLTISGGDFIIMATCAHEFGHIKQFELDANPHLERTVGVYGPELHADFLAGYFIRIFAERVPQTKLYEIGREWATLGHPTIPGSHGTSAQRVQSIEAGFYYAMRTPGRTFSGAFAAGEQFVQQFRS